jgi:hypothetical protein
MIVEHITYERFKAATAATFSMRKRSQGIEKAFRVQKHIRTIFPRWYRGAERRAQVAQTGIRK